MSLNSGNMHRCLAIIVKHSKWEIWDVTDAKVVGIMLAVAAFFDYEISQMDVKTEFP